MRDEHDQPGEIQDGDPADPPLFQHPSWMVGIVIVLAVVALAAGLDDPVWWLIGSPFIVVLAMYAWVRFRG